MAANNGNLAYDISVYEPKVKEPVRDKKPRIEVNRNTQVKPMAVGRLLFFGIMAAVLGLAILFGQVESNRLFGEISQLRSDIQTLKADNASLAAEYDSRTSLKSVEEYAKGTLGLQKLDKSQIEYVEFDGNGVIEVVETEKENIFVRIKNWLANLGEYLGA